MSCPDEIPSGEREIDLPAPPIDVWESLPSLLGDEVGLAAEPGGRVRSTGPEGERVGVVEEVAVPHRLSFWWVPVDGEDAPSMVELELDLIAGGTRLRVRETQFSAGAFVDTVTRGPLAVARA